MDALIARTAQGSHAHKLQDSGLYSQCQHPCDRHKSQTQLAVHTSIRMTVPGTCDFKVVDCATSVDILAAGTDCTHSLQFTQVYMKASLRGLGLTRASNLRVITSEAGLGEHKAARGIVEGCILQTRCYWPAHHTTSQHSTAQHMSTTPSKYPRSSSMETFPVTQPGKAAKHNLHASILPVPAC